MCGLWWAQHVFFLAYWEVRMRFFFPDSCKLAFHRGRMPISAYGLEFQFLSLRRWHAMQQCGRNRWRAIIFFRWCWKDFGGHLRYLSKQAHAHQLASIYRQLKWLVDISVLELNAAPLGTIRIMYFAPSCCTFPIPWLFSDVPLCQRV